MNLKDTIKRNNTTLGDPEKKEVLGSNIQLQNQNNKLINKELTTRY